MAIWILNISILNPHIQVIHGDLEFPSPISLSTKRWFYIILEFLLELISRQIINPKTNPLTFLTMEILNAEVAGENSETMDEVVFLYKVVHGSQACNSYGAWCASIAGVPTPIVRRGIYNLVFQSIYMYILSVIDIF